MRQHTHAVREIFNNIDKGVEVYRWGVEFHLCPELASFQSRSCKHMGFPESTVRRVQKVANSRVIIRKRNHREAFVIPY